MAKKFEIRNSTVEFLIFQLDGKEDGVQVLWTLRFLCLLFLVILFLTYIKIKRQ